MANAIVNRQVNVYINSGEAQKALDKLIAKEKQLNAELEKTKDPKRITALKNELAKLSEPIDRATKKLKGELAPTLRDLIPLATRLQNEFKQTGSPQVLAALGKVNAEIAKQKALLDSVSASAQRLTSKGIFSAAFWGNLAAGAITAVTSQISNFFRQSFDEALEADRISAQLRSTLDNLGRTDAFERISASAQRMADKFKFIDKNDILEVFNKLIDYGKLTEKQMNDLLPVIIDFAAKQRISLQESSDVIVKALEGNGRALKTYGIDIKDAGTETERLNVIMTTLKDKVDGAAEAFANSASGGIATAKQEFKNLQEEIGNGLLPVLNSLLDFFVKTAKGAKLLFNNIKDLFTLKAVGSTNAANNNLEAARISVEKTLTSIDKLKPEEKKAEIDHTIASINEALRLAKDFQKLELDETGVFKGQVTVGMFKNEKERDEDVAYQKERLRLLTEQKKALEDPAVDKILGIQQQDVLDKTKVKAEKATKAVKDLHAEFKKMLEISRTAKAFLEDTAGITPETEEQRKRREQEERLSKPAESNAAGALRRNVGILNSVFDANSRDKTAGLQLRLIQAHGKEKMAAELALLKEQEQQELQQKGLTENEKLLIEEQYRQKRLQKETEHWKSIADTTIFFAQQAVNVLDTLFSAANAKEDAQLERDRKVNDQKKNNFKRQLDGKMISQLEYDRQIRKLDKEQAKHEYEIELKKFKRNQITSISQALINGAQGATKTIAELGFPAAIPFLIAEGAAVLAQVIAISKQKPAPPVAFAKGGKLGGRSHAQGGNPILDGSGQKIAEIEAGEGIINKRSMGDGRKYTLSGTPSQIASSINTLHGGVNWEAGATIIPHWRTMEPQRMNFAAMKRAYAGGGVFQSTVNSQQSTADNNEMRTLLALNTQIMAQLSEQLKKPLKAYTLITEHEKTQDRLNSIRDDATMKG